MDAVLKARMLLASKISQGISKLYEETRAQFHAGAITEDQLASRIITLREKPITPEELSAETIEDSLDFSLEYLTRYEEEVSRNKEALQEKDRLLQVINEQKDRESSEKDEALAEKDQQIQAEQNRNAKLEAELSEYRKRDEKKKQKKQHRTSIIHLILGILWRVAAVVLLLVFTVFVCKKVDPSITTAVSIVVGVFSLIPTVGTFIKKDLKKYKDTDSAE